MSIPLVRLSVLELLRGFVAVGRRMSITLAAEDLHLTQSAVSRQVIALEERLGLQLLVRQHRSISLTAEGERLFKVADASLQQLQDVLGELGPTHGGRPVRLTASIGVTGLWLLPRLKRFQALHPDIDLRVSADNRVVDLRREGIDLAIRHCAQAPTVAMAVRLFGHSIAPVAHPSLGLGQLRSARDVAGFALLDYDDRTYPWLRWSEWLQWAGWGDAQPRSTQHFNQYDQVIQAAVAGQGIALGRIELLGDLLRDGRLVVLAPPRPAAPTDHAYWLVCADAHPRRQVELAARWIEEEAGRVDPVSPAPAPVVDAPEVADPVTDRANFAPPN